MTQVDLRSTVIKKSSKELSQYEKDKILSICNHEEYQNMHPNEIVPILAEKGIYLASETTFYKILRENKMLKHRSNSKPKKNIPAPAELTATGPNQVFSWDITYLKTHVRGLYFYLYLFMDIWSRKIVGWTIEECESGEIASECIKNICIENNIETVWLHSDNGSQIGGCGTVGVKQND